MLSIVLEGRLRPLVNPEKVYVLSIWNVNHLKILLMPYAEIWFPVLQTELPPIRSKNKIGHTYRYLMSLSEQMLWDSWECTHFWEKGKLSAAYVNEDGRNINFAGISTTNRWWNILQCFETVECFKQIRRNKLV